MTRMKQREVTVTAGLAAAFVAGCASQALPPEQFAASESAIAIARQSGAAEHAARELALAEEKLDLGKRFITARDMKPARWLVEQAKVDAELATMKAMSAVALKSAALATAELRARNSRLALAGVSQ
jgi:Domain of unknown function (DUF4398)